MKVFKHLNVLFMAQAAMIAAIYVRGTGPFIRGSDHPSCIYPGRDPRIIYRMSHQQYPRRMHSPGYYFRKPCDPDRSGIYMDTAEQEQISGASSADYRQCADCALGVEIWLRRAFRHSVPDGDRGDR